MIPRVGLTGGIGSGKSTVATAFRQHGIETLDADKIARELTSPGTSQFDEILTVFGTQILDENGAIVRSILGAIVFNDEEKRIHLETILHPAIRKTMQLRCESFQGLYCVVEIPLLIETGQWKEMDRVLVVTSTINNRIERLKDQRNMPLEKAHSILNIQMQDEERCKYADDIIENNSTPDAVTMRTGEIHQHYLEIFER